MTARSTREAAEDLQSALLIFARDEAGDTKMSEIRTVAGIAPTASTFDIWTVEGRAFRVMVTEVRE